MSAETLSEDELFAAIDHHVDVDVMSYDEARAAEGVDTLPTSADDNEFAQHLTPGAQGILSAIEATPHRSQLTAHNVGSMLGRASLSGEIKPDEVNELHRAAVRRREQLTAHAPENPKTPPVRRKSFDESREPDWFERGLPRGDRD